MSQGVKERWGGVDRVVGRCEKGEIGSPQGGRAVHGAGVVFCQPPLR